MMGTIPERPFMRSPFIGEAIGDIVGSVDQWDRIRTQKFRLLSPEPGFADDTALTMAVVHAIVNRESYGRAMRG